MTKCEQKDTVVFIVCTVRQLHPKAEKCRCCLLRLLCNDFSSKNRPKFQQEEQQVESGRRVSKQVPLEAAYSNCPSGIKIFLLGKKLGYGFGRTKMLCYTQSLTGIKRFLLQKNSTKTSCSNKRKRSFIKIILLRATWVLLCHQIQDTLDTLGKLLGILDGHFFGIA